MSLKRMKRSFSFINKEVSELKISIPESSLESSLEPSLETPKYINLTNLTNLSNPPVISPVKRVRMQDRLNLLEKKIEGYDDFDNYVIIDSLFDSLSIRCDNDVPQEIISKFSSVKVKKFNSKSS